MVFHDIGQALPGSTVISINRNVLGLYTYSYLVPVLQKLGCSWVANEIASTAQESVARTHPQYGDVP